MADRIVDAVNGTTIREMAGRSGSDSADNDTFQRSFLVKGNSDPLVCRKSMLDNRVALSLDTFANLNIDTMSWALFSRDDQWKFIANYNWTPLPGFYTVTMDTTGATTIQTEAFFQSRYPAPGEAAPNYATSVNVQPDGVVEGTDRVVGALNLQINARIVGDYIPDPISYAKTVAGVTGYYNSGDYLGFAAGELLFLGASGEIIGENPLLVYSFSASSNLTNWTIGGVPGVSKGGHDYVWAAYKHEKDPSGFNTAVTRGVYVAVMYEPTDFSVLKIGEL